MTEAVLTGFDGLNLALETRRETPFAAEHSERFLISVVDRFDFSAREYEDLFHASGASAFQHPAWLQAIYDQLVPACNATPIIVTVRDKSGKLFAVLPLIRRRKLGLDVVEYADLGVCDYTGMIAPGDMVPHLMGNPAFTRQLLRAMQPHDLVRIKHLTKQTRHLDRMLPGACLRQMPFSSHELSVFQPYEECRQQAFSKKLRKKLRKAHRDLSMHGEVKLEVAASPQRIRDGFEAMRKFRKPRYEGAEGQDLMQQEPYYNFYLDMALRGHADGFARTHVLTCGETIVAGLFGLMHEDRFMFLLLAVDYENFGECCPGYIIYDEVMRARTDAGDKVMDFTIGDEAFKSRFGTTAHPVYSLWLAGSVAGRMAGLCVDNMHIAKPYLKRVAAL